MTGVPAVLNLFDSVPRFTPWGGHEFLNRLPRRLIVIRDRRFLTDVAFGKVSLTSLGLRQEQHQASIENGIRRTGRCAIRLPRKLGHPQAANLSARGLNECIPSAVSPQATGALRRSAVAMTILMTGRWAVDKPIKTAHRGISWRPAGRLTSERVADDQQLTISQDHAGHRNAAVQV